MQRSYTSLSLWLDSLPGDITARPALADDLEVDLVIVGAGYTGIWTAYYLKQLQPTLSIAIAEAEVAGFGASGRNGGWCSSHLSGLDTWLDDETKRDDAIRLKRLMFDTVKQVGLVCEKENIDCHYERSGALEVAVLPVQLQRLQAEWRRLQELGFAEHEYRWLGQREVGELFNIDKALAGIHLEHCAAIHPARLARGLADHIESLGVQIFENSPVQSVEERSVRTAQGNVKADTVLLATEGYTANLKGHRYGHSLIPVHSMMVATEALNPEQLELIGFQKRCTFANYDRVTTYGQVTADNRIAFGCRGSYGFGSKIRHDFNPQDRDFELVRETLLRFFPALKGIRFTHAWGGAMGVSRSLHPAIHFDRDSGFGWAGGYFGSGVAATHLAGQTLAELVCNQNSERVDTPWVNPAYIQQGWEPEPLRWFGVHGTRRLMGVSDYFDYRGASFIGKALDALLPNL